MSLVTGTGVKSVVAFRRIANGRSQVDKTKLPALRVEPVHCVPWERDEGSFGRQAGPLSFLRGVWGSSCTLSLPLYFAIWRSDYAGCKSDFAGLKPIIAMVNGI